MSGDKEQGVTFSGEWGPSSPEMDAFMDRVLAPRPAHQSISRRRGRGVPPVTYWTTPGGGDLGPRVVVDPAVESMPLVVKALDLASKWGGVDARFDGWPTWEAQRTSSRPRVAHARGIELLESILALAGFEKRQAAP